MDKLKYEAPTKQRKKDAIEYIKEFREYDSTPNGSGGLHRYLLNYSGWLKKLKLDGVRPVSEQTVPALTYFLVRESDNKIVGMANIRLALNQSLLSLAGHIGYSIRPTERRKGYNKINLYLALKVCQEHNIKEVILDCKEGNIGSEKTIQALGGIFTKEFFSSQENSIIHRYTIEVDKSIDTYVQFSGIIQ